MATFYASYPFEGGGSGSSGVTSLNSLTGALDLVAGTGISITPAGSTITIAATSSGSGTVTSVALADSTGLFNITGSPVTTSGTLTLASFQSQAANTFLAAPNGSSGAPTFRTIVAADLPAGTGTVTSVSVVTANGLAGTVATATTTPAITLSTTVTGILQGNGTAISAATTGNLTDVGTDGIVITGGTGAVLGSGTSLAQHVADSTHNGYLSSTDWSTFNSKQAAGNYITDLTGDGTATGPGSVTFTLANVNGNSGSFGSSTSIPSFTVNAKGLITAAAANFVIAPAGTLTGTILASNVVTSSLTSVGTITSGTWNGTTIAIANGGTGQTTAAAAFNALNPMTTTGDLIYESATNVASRLAVGSTGQVLTVAGGIPSWAASSVPLSSITAAIATNTIDNLNFAQVWNWSTLSTGNGMTHGTTSLTAGNLVLFQSTSTAAASNTQTVLNVATSGANGTSTQTTYGAKFSNTHTGTASSNVALFATASGGTNNYAAIFNAGRVGIGTQAPSDNLEVRTSARISSASQPLLTILQDLSHRWDIGLGLNGTNDSRNFVIEDFSTLSNPFTIEHDAPTGSLYIKTNGYIGVNNSAPTNNIHILNNQTAGGFATNLSNVSYGTFNGIQDENTNATTDSFTCYGLRTASFDSALVNVYSGVASQGRMLLAVEAIEALTAKYNGFIGIGNSNPTSSLHVVASAQTVASAAGAEFTTGTFTPPTITLTGSTQVTSQMDSFIFNQPTITDASAVTVDNATTMTISGAPVKAGSVTLTNTYGVKINAGAVSTATNSYGLYVDAQTGATNNYAASFATGNVGIGTAAPAYKLDVAGNVASTTAGNGFLVKEGSNAKMGTSVLVGGTVTVSNTSVTANSRIFLTAQNNAGVPGFLSISARNAGTDFTITSSNIADTSTVAWIMFEPS